MFKSNCLAKKYSLLLFLTTEQTKSSQNIITELTIICNMISNCKFVKRFFNNLYITKTMQFLLFKALIYSFNISKILKNFIILLIRKNNLYLLRQILFLYRRIFNQKFDRIPLRITLYKSIPKNNLDEIKKCIYSIFFYRNHIVNFFYKKEALGGAIFDIDTIRLNLSTCFKLNYIESKINLRHKKYDRQ